MIWFGFCRWSLPGSPNLKTVQNICYMTKIDCVTEQYWKITVILILQLQIIVLLVVFFCNMQMTYIEQKQKTI